MPATKRFDANEHLTKAVAAIDAQISELQAKKAQLTSIIGGKAGAGKEKGKRQMSAASKEKISAAQRKRWAEAKKKK